jgi:hypothetical protein
MAPNYLTPFHPQRPTLKPWPLTLDDMHRHNLGATHEAVELNHGGNHPPTMTITATNGDQVLLEVSVREGGGMPFTLHIVALAFMSAMPVRYITWSAPTWYAEGDVAGAGIAANDPNHLQRLADAGDPSVWTCYMCGSIDLDAPTWDDGFRLDTIFPPAEPGGEWQLQQLPGTPVMQGALANAAKVLFDRGRLLAASAPAGTDVTTALIGLTATGFVLQALVPEAWGVL